MSTFFFQSKEIFWGFLVESLQDQGDSEFQLSILYSMPQKQGQMREAIYMNIAMNSRIKNKGICRPIRETAISLVLQGYTHSCNKNSDNYRNHSGSYYKTFSIENVLGFSLNGNSYKLGGCNE
jgi:hypothetical protein